RFRLLRHQGREGRHALRLGDAAGGDHLVEDRLARREPAGRDAGKRPVTLGSGLPVRARELRAKSRVSDLVTGRPSQKGRHGRFRIKRPDRLRQPCKALRRLALDARAKEPSLSDDRAKPLVHQPSAPPPSFFAVPASGAAVPPSRASGFFSFALWACAAQPAEIPATAPPRTS